MNKLPSLILFSILVTCPSTLMGQSMKDLDFLIGQWQLEEEVYPGTDKAYIERGFRECSYQMDSTYIHCESKASRQGKERVYISDINYNKGKKRFIMTTRFSDYDFRATYQLILSIEEKAIFITSPYDPTDGEFFRSRIDFSDLDKLVWEGWSSPFDKEPNWIKVYTEKAIRIK